jgi:hypothetical protein
MTHLAQTCATGSNPSIVSSNQQQLKMSDVSMNSQFSKNMAIVSQHSPGHHAGG